MAVAIAIAIAGERVQASPYDPPTQREPSSTIEDDAPLREASSPAAPSDEAPSVDPPSDPALPSEALTADDIEAQTGARNQETAPPPVADFMRPEGVEDPFPDRLPKSRPRHAGALLGLGLGVAVAATITARLTLLPQCADERDAMTCSIPDRADIGVRVGRLVGTVAFSIGGASLGAIGGRELAAVLRERAGVERGRRIAVGIGTSATIFGLVGTIAGATVLGVSAQRAVDVARGFQGVTELTDGDEARLDRMVHHVRTARVGLMVLSASPMLLATGIALLVHRPREPRVSVSPTASRRSFGLSARVRF